MPSEESTSTLADAATSRRELNKAATRAAIAEAAMRLLRTEGATAVTAERAADAAGVSRRTFFNYFPTVESALNEPTELFLEQALRQLESFPEDMPVLAAAVDAVRSLAAPRALASVAELFTLADNNPQLARLQLESWDRCADRLIAVFARRAPGKPTLDIAVLAYSIVGAGKAVFGHWAADGGGDLSDASIAALQGNLTAAMTQLRDGFPSLNTAAATGEA